MLLAMQLINELISTMYRGLQTVAMHAEISNTMRHVLSGKYALPLSEEFCFKNSKGLRGIHSVQSSLKIFRATEIEYFRDLKV